MLQHGEYRANVQLKLFLQLPDNAYASNSKCLLQFADLAALMQANVESTPSGVQTGGERGAGPGHPGEGASKE